MTCFRVQPGDRVAYSAAFLRSTGQQAGEPGHARGTVQAVRLLGEQQLVTVQWDIDAAPSKVLACNLAHVGPNSRFCAC